MKKEHLQETDNSFIITYFVSFPKKEITRQHALSLAQKIENEMGKIYSTFKSYKEPSEVSN